MPVSAQKCSKKCRHDKFREGWLKDFRWLETNWEMTTFCSICLKTKQKNEFTGYGICQVSQSSCGYCVKTNLHGSIIQVSLC